jgi:spore maturation protein CgeB
MGHDVHFYEKDVPYYSIRRDFDQCAYCTLVLYDEWENIRSQALDCARASDAVITASYLPEGRRINDEILELSGPLRVYYDLDTPVSLGNIERAGVEYIRPDQLSEFDLVLSFTGGKGLEELEKRYQVRIARPLYGCVDPDDYQRVPASDDFACDLSYMGTYAPDRQEKLDDLFLEPSRRHAEKQFLLAGTLYPWGWQWGPNVRRVDHVAPYDHPRFYSSSRITLNITRGEMARWGWCPSGRFFEAAACGTPVITDWWEGLDHFFNPGSEIRVVRSPEDVEEALGMSDAELSQMASQARERTLHEHTGLVRARQLLTYFVEARDVASNLSSEVAR